MRKAEGWFNNVKSQPSSSQPWSPQAGQAFLIIAIFISVFLLGALGLATDYAQIWARRQMAQAAADAACQAGAADLLLKYQDPTAGSAFPQVNFSWIGSPNTSTDCSKISTSPVCKYAALNSPSSANEYSGTNVSVSFPSSLPGAPAIPPGFGTITNPYVQVNITDPVPMWFSKLITSASTFNVTAKAGCGMLAVLAPTPITVLSPSASPSLDVQGAGSIVVYGGPTRSIQVNSHAATALNGGSGINLSNAGPNYTGADIGVFGGPTANPGVILGTTGHYVDPSAPIGDPFATIPAPSTAGMPAEPAGGSGTVAYHTNGCPDTGGCIQYVPGNYTSGIAVGPGSKVVAIFDPGVYYVNGGLSLLSNSIVRPSAANATTAPYGAIFYITGCTSNCIQVASNSGSKLTTDNFSTSTLTCPGGTAYAAPPGVTPPSQGNMLMAPCNGTYGDPSGLYRGILFYVDHSISAAQAGWGGGGGFILAGATYVHNTASSNDNFSMQGNSGSTSLVIGNMVVDTLTMKGTPNILMQLNPNASFPILKVELLQ
jgi:Flp pilus assembly protein TadG